MIRPVAAVVLAVVVGGGCASGGKLPVFGNWRVKSYQIPDAADQASVQSLSWIGMSASYGRKEVRLGVERCYSPVYTSQTLSVQDFTAQYKVAPSTLGLTGETITMYMVDCPKDPAHRSMALIVKGPDNIVVPKDGTFFQMERLVTGGRLSSY